MVIKTAQWAFPFWPLARVYRMGVEIAEQVGMTLIGRMKANGFNAYQAANA